MFSKLLALWSAYKAVKPALDKAARAWAWAKGVWSALRGEPGEDGDKPPFGLQPPPKAGSPEEKRIFDRASDTGNQ